MFYLELSTGLRRGELVALLWSDLNLQTKTLTVAKSVSRGKGELVVTEPKTENSVREIYLSDEAIRLLVEDRKNHPFSPYMFPSPKTGGMYGPDCVGRIHKKLLEKAGTEKEKLSAAIALAFEHDTEVIVEEAIDGFEVGCAILGNDVLTVGRVDEIELSSGFFDYTEKYTLKTSQIHMPARIDATTEKKIQDTALRIYKALGCSGFARVDLFLSANGNIVFNEVNTIPGLTSHSRYPNMMKGIGLSFAKMLDRLIGLYIAP